MLAAAAYPFIIILIFTCKVLCTLFQGFQSGQLKIMGKNIVTDKNNCVSSLDFLQLHV